MHTWCSIRYKHADLFTSLSGYAAGICFISNMQLAMECVWVCVLKFRQIIKLFADGCNFGT